MAEERGSQKNRIAAWVWAGVVVLLMCQVAVCIAAGRKSLRGDVDFRAFYTAGAIVRSGDAARLYDYGFQEQLQNQLVGARAGALPFLYPSFAALPFVPLSVLNYRVAFLIFLAVNLGFLILTAILLRPWLTYLGEFGWVALTGMYGCLLGVSIALMQGQISFALLTVYSGAWVLLKKERPVVAGMLLSLGLMKFQIAIPIIVLFLLWRQWKVVAGFLVGGAGLCGISLMMIGRAGALSYLRSMAGMTRQTAIDPTVAKAHYGMFPVDMPNVHGLTFGISHGASWGLALNIVLCCVVLIFAARQKASLLVALPAAMLVSYHLQPHDLTLLLLPLSFEVDALVWAMERRRRGKMLKPCGSERALVWALLLLVLPLGFAVMAAGANFVVSLAVCAVMVHAVRMDSSGLPLKERKAA